MGRGGEADREGGRGSEIGKARERSSKVEGERWRVGAVGRRPLIVTAEHC